MTRFLIADDHEVVLRGLRDILTTRLGCDLEVSEARSATEAINLLIQSDWDVIILDINMPGLGGMAVCRLLG